MDTAAQLTGPPGPIIANFNQMLLMVANDNTKQSKDLLVPRFNKIVEVQKLRFGQTSSRRSKVI
jgi:hypothetical protein